MNEILNDLKDLYHAAIDNRNLFAARAAAAPCEDMVLHNNLMSVSESYAAIALRIGDIISKYDEVDPEVAPVTSTREHCHDKFNNIGEAIDDAS